MHDAGTLEVLALSGSPYEIGLRHGAAHRARIAGFLGDRLARLNAVLFEPVSLESLRPEIRRYATLIERSLPRLHEELLGLAEGARISPEEALLLQLRRELLGYRKIPSRGDCTLFARRSPGAVVLGQTIDLNGDMSRELCVLRIRHPGGNEVLLVSFTGLLGYLGMNDRGVAIGLNLVLGGEWGPGVPAYMAIRHLLDCAASVADCLALLRELPLASSRALTICDRARSVGVEFIRDEIRVREGDDIAHANHFLDDAFRPRDALNPFARNSSLARMAACQAAVRRLPPDCAMEEYFELFSAAPICVDGAGDERRECTVGAVVMRPDRGEMLVRQGHPRSGARGHFGFAAPGKEHSGKEAKTCHT